MKSDLGGRISNTKLLYKDGLMAVKEAVVNSIQAIELASEKNGIVTVTVKRIGNQHLDGIESPKIAPIDSVEIRDNGIGFDDENFSIFNCLDKSAKRERFGCKGMGRLMWLKAFSSASIESAYQQPEGLKTRSFEFRIGKADEDDVVVTEGNNRHWDHRGTCVTLKGFKSEYSNASPREFEDISHDILAHCIRDLVVESGLQVIVRDDDGSVADLGKQLKEHTIKKSSNYHVCIGAHEFETMCLLVSSDLPVKSGVFWCADGRVVTINEHPFSNQPIFENALINGEKLLCVVQSKYLNDNVRGERNGFLIRDHKERRGDRELVDAPSFDEIEDAIWKDAVADFLKELIKKAEESNKERLGQAFQDFPQFGAMRGMNLQIVLPVRADRITIKKVLRKAYTSVEDEIDTKLDSYVKKLNPRSKTYQDDILKYTKVILSQNFIAAKSVALASYVAKRKAVIEGFQRALQLNDEGKYEKESVLHSLIVPMKTDSEKLLIDDSNLWLLDDCLAFHNYLASDLPMEEFDPNSFEGVVGEKRRMDVAVFRDFWQTATDEQQRKITPMVTSQTRDARGALTVVEFKRPQRTDRECVEQVVGYIERLTGQGNAVKYKGRPIKTNDLIQAFIVCDIVQDFKSWLENRDYKELEEGHFYKMYDRLHAIVHVLSFETVLKMARERNDAFFRQLGIN